MSNSLGSCGLFLLPLLQRIDIEKEGSIRDFLVIFFDHIIELLLGQSNGLSVFHSTTFAAVKAPLTCWLKHE